MVEKSSSNWISRIERLSLVIHQWKEIKHPPETLLKLLAKLFGSPNVEIVQVVQTDSCTVDSVRLGGYSSPETAKKLIETDAYLQIVKDFICSCFPGNQTELIPRRIGSFEKNSKAIQVVAIPIFLRESVSGFLFITGALSGSPIDVESAPGIKIVQNILGLKYELFDLEKRITDICDFTPEPTLILDAKGKTRLWNKAFVTISGWEADRVIGKGNHIHGVPFYGKRRTTLPDMILKPDPEGEKEYIEFQQADDGIYSLAFCPALPGGGAYVRTKTSKILDLNNRLFGAIHTLRDVTRQREMERDLQRNEKIQKAVNKFSGLGIITFSRNEVVYHNHYIKEMLDAIEHEVCKEDIYNLLEYVPNEAHEMARGFFRLLNGKLDKSVTIELPLFRNGYKQLYQCYVQPDESDRESLIHFIVEDITEKRDLEERIRLGELKMYHEDRLSALGTMAAGIAHELNQPLNAIKTECSTFLWELEERSIVDTDEFKKSFDMIYQQVERMSKVIRNVRLFARDDKSVVIRSVDLNGAVSNVLSMVGVQIENQGVKIKKDLEIKPIYIQGDMSQVEQVIMNLIVNARQALEDSSREDKTIIITTKIVDKKAFLMVEDNGLGIPRMIEDKIFDPFFTTKDAGKGTGLGLTISRSIVKDLGGSLELIKSNLAGTAFSILIPLNTQEYENIDR